MFKQIHYVANNGILVQEDQETLILHLAGYVLLFPATALQHLITWMSNNL